LWLQMYSTCTHFLTTVVLVI